MITTSRQLAAALGEDHWEAQSTNYPIVQHAEWNISVSGGDALSWTASAESESYGDTPKEAVLALADELEAEARALRESVRKEGP